MRVPISWLGEFTDLPDDVTHEHVHAALVRVGLEEEDVHTFDVTGPVVVGRVLELIPEPQTNGKTINWCQVDVGEPEPRGIVCGAHNFGVGDKVVVSLPGAVLPGPFPISARKTYGHVSDGMIASARELGLGDEHDGILRLIELGLDPEVGADAIELLGLDDFAVEVNVTPDRGYAFSVRGIAREYSNSTGAAFRDPAHAVQVPAEAPTGVDVSVRDDAPIRGNVGCSVFATRVVRGIDPARPTPPWLISRLTLAGIRSISLTVDITNYVMLELGQPIHAYDLARLDGGIIVRRAAAGETLTTLDDKQRTLDTEDLLITDGSGPIGLAGVMGGASTEVGPETTDVLVEAAHFDPVSIARTARRHKLPSEASRRFERGVDPRVAPAAAARVVELLVELAGGTADAAGSLFDASPEPTVIDLPEGFVERLVGVDFSADEITDSLQAIGADVAVSESGWAVTVPSWRPDLDTTATLAEEVARIVGYDRIPSVLPTAPPGRGLTREQRLRRIVADGLAAAGLVEVLAYPFVSQADNARFGSPDDAEVPAVGILNPMDATVPFLRTSLLPGLIGIAHRNLSRGLVDLGVYEIGSVVRPTGRSMPGALPLGARRPSAEQLERLNGSIPAQPLHLGALFVGDSVLRQPGAAAVPSGVADAIATARHLAASIAVPLTVHPGRHKALHPGRTAELRIGEAVVGYAGELLPAVAAEHDLPRVVGVLELDLDAVLAAASADIAARPIVAMPAATQDLSLVVPVAAPAAEVAAAVAAGSGDLLEDIRLVDDYRGQGVAEGTKSLTFALRFRAADRTLTAAEATEAKKAGVAEAAARFGASLRE